MCNGIVCFDTMLILKRGHCVLSSVTKIENWKVFCMFVKCCELDAAKWPTFLLFVIHNFYSGASMNKEACRGTSLE